MHSPFRLTLAALAVACACPAWADDAARLKELEARLDASQRALQTLQQRLDQLEKRDSSAAAAPGQWGARVETVERTLAQIEAATAAAAQVDNGLPIHGFADVGAGVRNKAADGQALRGFKVGVFDLYMTPQISSQVKALVELAFEYGKDGALGVDAERLQLGYVYSDALTVWGGRFHTPYGYWNTAFHHGAQLQTALSRPRFLDFEDAGGILPAHSVGLWGTGSVRTGLGKLGYDAYVVNGDRINQGVLDYQAIGDSDSQLGTGFRTHLDLGASGWSVGVHGLSQRVAGDNATSSARGASRVGMLGGYTTFDNDDWELMAEGYAFRNRDLAAGGASYTSRAWYGQVGRNLTDQLTPYVRLERALLNDADPYFALQDSGRSYHRSVAGLRYHLTPKAALKAEWTQTHEDGSSAAPSSVAVQYSIRF